MSDEKQFEFNSYLIDHADELRRFSRDVNILSVSALTQLQRLPVSLRRRAASHNIKRLPFRFRKSANAVTAAKVVKRCRKYKRRHLNVKAIYLKRQSKRQWLYTHIWHAKRFMMVDKWGWKIPLAPCQKTFRPCTKSMTNGCSAVDLSYFCALEIVGKINRIVKAIRKLMPKTVDSQSLPIKDRIKSGREINTTFYRPNEYPFGAICPCKIIRINSEQSTGSSLLISFHPSAKSEVICALTHVLSIRECYNGCWITENSEDETINNKSMVMRDRSAEFCRFRLLGHLSQTVAHALISNSSNTKPGKTGLPLSSVPRGFAIQLQIDNLNVIKPIMKQTDMSHLSLNEGSKHEVNVENGVSLFDDVSLPDSSLFASSVDILNHLRSPNLFSLNNLLQIDLESPKQNEICPVLLTRIHYTDVSAPGGWDIVVPAKWAITMWTTLVMRGCRPMGLKYWSRYCALEATSLISKSDCFPGISWPDTVQGSLEAEYCFERDQTLWKRKPPSKRVNYTNNITAEPFRCNWSSLLPDPSHSFYVMRDIKILFRVVDPILKGTVKPSLAQLDQFYENARYALVPVILNCPSTAAISNAVLMAAQIDDDLSSPLEQPLLSPQACITNDCHIRPVIGFVQLADQSLIVGKGRAFGFVSLYQLVRLCASYRPVKDCWFKNTNTRRFVRGQLTLSI